MIPLAFALWLRAAPAAPDPRPWRLVDLPALHVGLRPHVLLTRDEQGAAVTLQASLSVL